MSKWFVLISIVLIVLVSCKKWVDPGLPTNELVAPKVYDNDSLANAALNYVYNGIMTSFGLLNGYTTKWTGLYGDELDKAKPENDELFISNSLTKDDVKMKELWNTSYKLIYYANDVITGVKKSASLRAETSNQLIGEALFLRSLFYFYLANLFGDVPLVTGIDPFINATLPQTPVPRIYDQLIADLKEAEKRLDDTYKSRLGLGYEERVRANKKSATALLARIYLYQQKWAEAEEAATAVINSQLYHLETDVLQTFLIPSKEAILQFMPVSKIYNTAEGSFFVPVVPTSKPAITLTDTIIKSFEAGDKRWKWIREFSVGGNNYYSPYKYKISQKSQGSAYQEYNVVLRLAEQYLIRAEARMMQNKLQAATEDINVIRVRAGINELPVFGTISAAMTALQAERCRELFAEWGQRWFDLKRWASSVSLYQSKADEVMSQRKPLTWKSTDLRWPIPHEQILLNPALKQNPGY